MFALVLGHVCDVESSERACASGGSLCSGSAGTLLLRHRSPAGVIRAEGGAALMAAVSHSSPPGYVYSQHGNVSLEADTHLTP